MKRKVLIVVDMQNDFIDGALGSSEAVSIVSNVKAKIEEYQKTGDIIVFTRDSHTEDYLNTQEGTFLPVPHCIVNSEGWAISNKLDTTGATIINKPTFGSTQLAQIMKTEFDTNEIELVGLCTDICVISNALLLKAYMPEVKITVDASCCAGVTPVSHKNALEAMKMCQINIINE